MTQDTITGKQDTSTRHKSQVQNIRHKYKHEHRKIIEHQKQIQDTRHQYRQKTQVEEEDTKTKLEINIKLRIMEQNHSCVYKIINMTRQCYF